MPYFAPNCTNMYQYLDALQKRIQEERIHLLLANNPRELGIANLLSNVFCTSFLEGFAPTWQASVVPDSLHQ